MPAVRSSAVLSPMSGVNTEDDSQLEQQSEEQIQQREEERTRQREEFVRRLQQVKVNYTTLHIC